MEENPDEALPSAVRITDPGFRGTGRHALGEEPLVLKAPRQSGPRKVVEEWLNELVCHRLGLRLRIPVADTSIKRRGDGELWLASTRHSDVTLKSIPAEGRVEIVNIDALPGLLVFDQLIHNSDRREDHVMLTDDPRISQEARWYAIDHGHTFHGPSGDGITVEMVEGIATQLAPVGIDYRVGRFADLESWLCRVEALSDYAIDSLVDESAAHLTDYGVPIDVRARVEFRKEFIKAFLKSRQYALPGMLTDWWETIGTP